MFRTDLQMGSVMILCLFFCKFLQMLFI